MFYSTPTSSFSTSHFMSKVYAWMSAALTVSAGTAYAIYADQTLFMAMMTNRLLFYGLLIGQFLLAVLFPVMLRKVSAAAAAIAFFAYSVMFGATLSVIFAVYQMASIVTVFGIAAGIFAIFAIYGYVTKADLTSMGNILTMALFGLILASLINIFMRSQGFDYIISFIGVLIFCGLIAFDTQKIKEFYYSFSGRAEDVNKIALLGAFILYLDFVNLFLYLLRLLGKRKD